MSAAPGDRYRSRDNDRASVIPPLSIEEEEERGRERNPRDASVERCFILETRIRNYNGTKRGMKNAIHVECLKLDWDRGGLWWEVK